MSFDIIRYVATALVILAFIPALYLIFAYNLGYWFPDIARKCLIPPVKKNRYTKEEIEKLRVEGYSPLDVHDMTVAANSKKPYSDLFDVMYVHPLRKVPLFINSPNSDVRRIAKWRLEIGK